MGLAHGISQFLQGKVEEGGSFPGRTYYGETFALALFGLCGVEDKLQCARMLNFYAALDQSSCEFHWEFNNYALLTYRDLTGDSRINDLVFPLRMKGTPCTNWTLLRYVGECLAGGDRLQLARDACRLLGRRQLPSGLILDEKQVKSFQYHCFSAAMIYELFQLTGDVLLRARFLRAVSFVRRFILKNGEALYIGRGQNQSFGYGALAYILAAAHKLTHDETLLDQLGQVLGYLMNCRREDGDFPLVVGGCEQHIPEVVSLSEPEFAGWYPYNNYYDYLPFLGFFLAKAAGVLSEDEVGSPRPYLPADYRDSDYRIVCRDKYTAVIARPGGYWTNDLAIPYISGHERLMPCYGGEQFQESLYDETMLGVPYFPRFHRSVRWRALSRFVKDSLLVASPLGCMLRSFRFDDNIIEIHTRVISVFPYQHMYAFLDETLQETNAVLRHPAGLMVYSNMPLEFVGYGYSASGRLKLFSSCSGYSALKLVINNNVS